MEPRTINKTPIQDDQPHRILMKKIVDEADVGFTENSFQRFNIRALYGEAFNSFLMIKKKNKEDFLLAGSVYKKLYEFAENNKYPVSFLFKFAEQLFTNSNNLSENNFNEIFNRLLQIANIEKPKFQVTLAYLYEGRILLEIVSKTYHNEQFPDYKLKNYILENEQFITQWEQKIKFDKVKNLELDFPKLMEPREAIDIVFYAQNCTTKSHIILDIKELTRAKKEGAILKDTPEVTYLIEAPVSEKNNKLLEGKAIYSDSSFVPSLKNNASTIFYRLNNPNDNGDNKKGFINNFIKIF